MARIDSLLNRMKTNGATRVYFQSDSPSLWQLPSGTIQGNTISSSDLEMTISEVAPPAAQTALKTSGSASFLYGGYSFIVQREGQGLILDVALPEPEPVAPPPTPASVAPANPYGAPANPYGAQRGAFNNSSGQGAMADVPPEAQRWNWGAFFLNWIWAIGNNTWIGLLCFVPCVGWIMPFVLGAKGSEWSWRNRRWNSVAEFQSAQRTWGIVGAVVCVFSIFVVPTLFSAITFPVFARARQNAMRASCQSNLKQIGLGVLMFAQDHNQRLPAGNADQWQSQIAQYAPSRTLFHCPADKSGFGSSYTVNPKLSGIGLANIPTSATTPMVWDNDSVEHLEGRNVLFADGHVKWMRESDWQSQYKPFTQ